VMALCAACVSTVFAVLQREETAAQVAFGARIFGALMGGGLLIGLLRSATPL